MTLDLMNKRFGRLTVIKKDENNNKREIKYICKCDCGEVVSVYRGNLTSGGTLSCGCYGREQVSKANKRYNEYIFFDKYVTGLTSNKKEFYFDKDDFYKIKNYCWRIDFHNYVVSDNEDGKIIKLHHLIMDFSISEKKIDHKDRNKLNNRKENLRLANSTENNRNISVRKDNKSGIIGVSIASNRFQTVYVCQIQVDKIKISLGCHENFDEAVRIRLIAEKKYFGEFAPQKHLFERYGI